MKGKKTIQNEVGQKNEKDLTIVVHITKLTDHSAPMVIEGKIFLFWSHHQPHRLNTPRQKIMCEGKSFNITSKNPQTTELLI